MKKGDLRKSEPVWLFFIAFVGVFFLILFLFKKKDSNLQQESFLQEDSLNVRQEEILGILKLDGEVAVDDLMYKIKNVSERTLRRDMNKLQSLGFCGKQGNTKGSKYIYTN